MQEINKNKQLDISKLVLTVQNFDNGVKTGGVVCEALYSKDIIEKARDDYNFDWRKLIIEQLLKSFTDSLEADPQKLENSLFLGDK